MEPYASIPITSPKQAHTIYCEIVASLTLAETLAHNDKDEARIAEHLERIADLEGFRRRLEPYIIGQTLGHERARHSAGVRRGPLADKDWR